MPKAMVATTTTPSSFKKRSWLRSRTVAIETGMIRERVAPTCPQPADGLLNCAPGEAIDDPRVGGVFLGEKPPKLFEWIVLGDDSVEQVGAIIAGGEDPCLGKLKLCDDVATCRTVRGRGERQERHPGKALLQDRELLIFRAEMMTPLGDAVRFVDGEQAEAAAGEQLEAAWCHQSLRRNVNEVERPVTNRAFDFRRLARGQS